MTWNAKVDAHVAEAVRALLDGGDFEAIRRDPNVGLDYCLDHLIGDSLYDAPEGATSGTSSTRNRTAATVWTS